MNYRKRKLRQKVLKILLRNHKNNNDANSKKILTIKTFLCFQKLHAYTNINVKNKNQLLKHKRSKKRTAFMALYSRIAFSSNSKILFTYAVKFRKRRYSKIQCLYKIRL